MPKQPPLICTHRDGAKYKMQRAYISEKIREEVTVYPGGVVMPQLFTV